MKYIRPNTSMSSNVVSADNVFKCYGSLMRNNPYRMIFTSGLFSSAVQVVFLREIVAVFSGNEIVFSFTLAVWLLAAGAGSRIFQNSGIQKAIPFIFLNALLSLIVLLGIRSASGLVLPGEVFPPVIIVLLSTIAVAPCAFCSGALFGILAHNKDGSKFYRWENGGSITGALLSALLIQLQFSHVFIVGVAIIFSVINLFQKKKLVLTVLAIFVLFLTVDKNSVRWKYHTPVDKILYGKSGELAFDTLNRFTYLNNRLYRSEENGPVIEQAVHVPLSIREGRRVLVIQNTGHIIEVKKYNSRTVQCIEDEPLLSDSLCQCTSVDKIQAGEIFDFVLLGSGLPDNISSNRYFTDEYFKKIHRVMADSGIFSFTFQLNTEYADGRDKNIIHTILATLSRNFKYVHTFQSVGITFIASDVNFPPPFRSTVQDRYFTTSILPDARMGEFTLKRKQDGNSINSVDKPTLIQMCIERYLHELGVNSILLIVIAVLLMTALIPVFIRSRSMLSIGSTGFCIGIYSVIIMMVYQLSYGNLYSRITVLTVSMSIGFVLGSYVKKLPFSDLIIGLYIVISIFVFLKLQNEVVFFVCNGFMGVLGGAQFVTVKRTSWGNVNAADLFGGVLGVLCGATIMLPGLGVFTAAITLFILKVGVFIINHRKHGSTKVLEENLFIPYS